MTYAFLQTVTEGTWGDYERINDELGDSPPEGLILHVAGPHQGGFRVIDVWESKEAWDRFRDQRLMPAVTQALGDRAGKGPPPSLEGFEVQHTLKL